MKAGSAIAVGVTVTVLVHAGLGASYALWASNNQSETNMQGEVAASERAGEPRLCDGRRCRKNERRKRRRAPEEPPIEELEVLEAAMIPALGMVAPVPDQVPEIETYEEPEVVEEAVNIEKKVEAPKKVVKDSTPKPKKQEKPEKKSLNSILDKHRNDDPRATPKSLDKITGYKDGEVGGQVSEKRLGSIYSARASKAIRKHFRPSMIERSVLKRLRAKIKVTKISFDGSVKSFRVIRKSGNSRFDDAALAAVKKFAPSAGGSKRLPAPEPAVLSYINTKGMVITFDGKHAR